MAGVAGALRVRLAAPAANGATAPLVVEAGPDGGAIVDGRPEATSLALLGGHRARLSTSDEPPGVTVRDVLVLPLPHPDRPAGVSRLEVVIDGWRVEVDVEPEARASLRERATRAGTDRATAGPMELRAIIPGRIVSVEVAEGDAVEAGGRVLVVEAMKMQNEVRAPRSGTVRRIDATAGKNVEPGDVLLVIE
jgi:biotin carboxyl carrier protein